MADIEITPLMIEAGLNVLCDHVDSLDTGYSLGDVAALVFAAMDAARTIEAAEGRLLNKAPAYSYEPRS